MKGIRESQFNEALKDACELRRVIHSWPELGNGEQRTAEVIEAYLDRLGIPHERYLDTAVIGRLRLGASDSENVKTVAIRADIDALPIEEKTGCSWSSKVPGVMHACGHDVHTAALLGAARLLADADTDVSGNIVLIFQPDEEGSGGAMRLIEEGLLDGVQAVFGAHVVPDIPEGSVGIRYGKFYAASDMYDITITGRACHGAQPEKGIDALAAACEAAAAIKHIADDETDRCAVTTGLIRAGSVRNAVADSALLQGIIRSLGPENRARLKSGVEECVREACSRYGASPEISFIESYSGIVNTDKETEIAEKAAVSEFGEDKVVRINEPLMTTEDFGFYVEKCTGCFYHIGAGCSMPLHHPEYLPTDRAVETAMRMHYATAMSYLEDTEDK